MEGWIKLHRKFLKWEWYTTPHMVHLFTYLLLSANHTNGKWQGISIKRGQLITGYNKLKANTGISVRSLRTCIERLKSTGEVTIQTTNKYSIITLCKYEDYQSMYDVNDTQNDKESNNQPTRNRHATDNKQEEEEYKEGKEEKISLENFKNSEEKIRYENRIQNEQKRMEARDLKFLELMEKAES